jgi:hypothetical protein
MSHSFNPMRLENGVVRLSVDPARLAGLIDDVGAALETERANVSLVRWGDASSPYGSIPAAWTSDTLARGVAVIDSIPLPPSWQSLSAELRAAVSCREFPGRQLVFRSPANTAAPWHRDESSSCNVQLAGRKRWHWSGVDGESSCDVGPGDVLVTPVGVLHRVEALAEFAVGSATLRWDSRSVLRGHQCNPSKLPSSFEDSVDTTRRR